MGNEDSKLAKFGIWLGVLGFVASVIWGVVSSLAPNDEGGGGSFSTIYWAVVGILFVFWAAFYFRFSRRSYKKLAQIAMKDAYLQAPKEKISPLEAFLESVLPKVVDFENEYGKIDRVKVTALERSFFLEGKTVITKERYYWKNLSTEARANFRIVQFGGNIQSLDTISAEGWQRVNGEEVDRLVRSVHSTDRFIVINLRLDPPVLSGNASVVGFQDRWVDAMLADWDFVLTPHCNYFRVPIGKLSMSLHSDQKLGTVSSYKINTRRGTVKDVTHQIKVSENRREVVGEFLGLSRGDIVFFLFERIDHE